MFRFERSSWDFDFSAQTLILIKNNHDPAFVCCIYPTAAFVKPSDILKGYRMIKKGK